MLVGCSVDFHIGSYDDEVYYDGSDLNIGVIGEIPDEDFDNVMFYSTDPESLKVEEFDAYFITAPYFDELSQSEWTPVFSSIHVPVFFMNVDSIDLVFQHEDLSYEQAEAYPATEHTTGFVHKDDGMLGWGYGEPSNSTNINDTPDWIYHSIFNDIEEFHHDY